MWGYFSDIPVLLLRGVSVIAITFFPPRNLSLRIMDDVGDPKVPASLFSSFCFSIFFLVMLEMGVCYAIAAKMFSPRIWGWMEVGKFFCIYGVHISRIVRIFAVY